MKKQRSGNLNLIRKEIQTTHLILIISITILLSFGGTFINIKSSDKSFNQTLQDTSALIARLYSFTKNLPQNDFIEYMDSVVKTLPDVDVISIVGSDNVRIYHTNHSLIGTEFDGSHPDFNNFKDLYFTENSIGPSGPQRRSYKAIFNSDGEYDGFIMAIRLRTSIVNATIHTTGLFLVVVLASVLIELSVSGAIFRKIRHQFLTFTEDFEGTKFLVDSMRANNHDFTNKLHVILGLIQIGEYEKAQSYIQNISIIQRETVSRVMNAVDNSSFAALLIGKIARASECNVKFILEEGISFKSGDIDIPSEALVTITGNLIDNALDSMNSEGDFMKKSHELTFGVYTKPENLLITVKDNGTGIPEEIKDKVFENGFSTKGSGRGVGLYHTKQLVESLGGTISFETQSRNGCCFMVKIER